ncbi:MAG: NAD-dependent epimerase/dehydratase family protein [Deltaproteobacteria bacterium]|nr:NAD-dependent epimerase/dehydratase family protein [Deltaproteobacteria bacterium]
MSKQSVVVTGAAGFVGRHLVDALVQADYDVVASDITPRIHRQDVRYERVDIRDLEAVTRLLEGADGVIHNASMVHTRDTCVADVWAINHGGTAHMLRACRAQHVPRFVYVSSGSVVYQGEDIEAGDESLPYCRIPQAPYAESKIAAEQDVLAASDDDLASVALRPHVIFGPHDGRFLPAILERANAGRLRYGVGRENKLSDFTYVENLVDACLAALRRVEPGAACAGKPYFITNGEPMAFWDFVGRMLEALDLPPIRGRVPYAVAYGAAAVAEAFKGLRGDTLGADTGLSRFAIRYMCTHHYFRIEAAERDLGWTPAVDLREGIARTAQFLKQSGAMAGRRSA